MSRRLSLAVPAAGTRASISAERRLSAPIQVLREDDQAASECNRPNVFDNVGLRKALYREARKLLSQRRSFNMHEGLRMLDVAVAIFQGVKITLQQQRVIDALRTLFRERTAERSWHHLVIATLLQMEKEAKREALDTARTCRRSSEANQVPDAQQPDPELPAASAEDASFNTQRTRRKAATDKFDALVDHIDVLCLDLKPRNSDVSNQTFELISHLCQRTASSLTCFLESCTSDLRDYANVSDRLSAQQGDLAQMLESLKAEMLKVRNALQVASDLKAEADEDAAKTARAAKSDAAKAAARQERMEERLRIREQRRASLPEVPTLHVSASSPQQAQLIIDHLTYLQRTILENPPQKWAESIGDGDGEAEALPISLSGNEVQGDTAGEADEQTKIRMKALRRLSTRPEPDSKTIETDDLRSNQSLKSSRPDQSSQDSTVDSSQTSPSTSADRHVETETETATVAATPAKPDADAHNVDGLLPQALSPVLDDSQAINVPDEHGEDAWLPLPHPRMTTPTSPASPPSGRRVTIQLEAENPAVALLAEQAAVARPPPRPRPPPLQAPAGWRRIRKLSPDSEKDADASRSSSRCSDLDSPPSPEDWDAFRAKAVAKSSGVVRPAPSGTGSDTLNRRRPETMEISEFQRRCQAASQSTPSATSTEVMKERRVSSQPLSAREARAHPEPRRSILRTNAAAERPSSEPKDDMPRAWHEAWDPTLGAVCRAQRLHEEVWDADDVAKWQGTASVGTRSSAGVTSCRFQRASSPFQVAASHAHGSVSPGFLPDVRSDRSKGRSSVKGHSSSCRPPTSSRESPVEFHRQVSGGKRHAADLIGADRVQRAGI
eukprot:TRINITY_DN35899_c0_g1_i1.p1 TRINITY_DN35899_c0_g1~~TRINITY_DN35899_c0_g1_i1.p1  ORF type:complete len:840 (-),score=133.77 TRINITY_DN35899_c0_g1_i1:9-2528(-)